MRCMFYAPAANKRIRVAKRNIVVLSCPSDTSNFLHFMAFSIKLNKTSINEKLHKQRTKINMITTRNPNTPHNSTHPFLDLHTKHHPHPSYDQLLSDVPVIIPFTNLYKSYANPQNKSNKTLDTTMSKTTHDSTPITFPPSTRLAPSSAYTPNTRIL